SVLGTAAVSAGRASLAWSFTSPGGHGITASYGGDAANAGSTSAAVALSVGTVSASTTTLAAAPNPAYAGQSLTLTASVSGNNPAGSVSFRDGSSTLGTVALAGGRAVLATTFASAGTRTLSANYTGNAGNNPSSGSLALSVAAAPTVAWQSGYPALASVAQGASVDLRVTTNANTGTVTFLDGATVLGSATVGQSCSSAGGYAPSQACARLAMPAAGSRVVTARYVAGSGANPVQVTATINVTSAASRQAGYAAPVAVNSFGLLGLFGAGNMAEVIDLGAFRLIDAESAPGAASPGQASASMRRRGTPHPARLARTDASLRHAQAQQALPARSRA
ncbi:MAG: Ig-like domain repeat protein, partial [Rhodocyclaceae bacterium]|nr:Ig-like domain repeat protein [Rhodocyclaceae bacterium]